MPFGTIVGFEWTGRFTRRDFEKRHRFRSRKNRLPEGRRARIAGIEDWSARMMEVTRTAVTRRPSPNRAGRYRKGAPTG
jgi:hypothetical protein